MRSMEFLHMERDKSNTAESAHAVYDAGLKGGRCVTFHRFVVISPRTGTATPVSAIYIGSREVRRCLQTREERMIWQWNDGGYLTESPGGRMARRRQTNGKTKFRPG